MADALEGALTHLCRDLWRSEHALECSGQCIHVAHRIDKSLNTICYQVGLAACVIGDDYGPARVHRLIHNQSPGLMARGQHKHAAQIEEARHLRLIAESAEPQVGKAILLRLLLQCCSFLAISYD